VAPLPERTTIVGIAESVSQKIEIEPQKEADLSAI